MRLEISQVDIVDGDYDWQVHQLSDFYLNKIIHFANKIGLEGKKIKKIVKVEPTFMSGLYIDFITEDTQK